MTPREHADVDGLTISYRRAGEGPPLVLLHGIGGNSIQWRHQLAGLSDMFTVVAWDAPGYGESSDPAEDWSMADHAERLAGFMDALEISRAHVLGQSWGGVLALELYRRQPQRIRSLILSDTFPGGRSQPEEKRLRDLESRLASVERMTPREMARGRAPALLAPGASADVAREVEDMLAEIRPTGYRMAAIVLADADERDVLPAIQVPTLVITGEHDRVVSPDAGRAMAGTIPNAQPMWMADAGHLGSQEQPKRYNTALREFLLAVEPTAYS